MGCIQSKIYVPVEAVHGVADAGDKKSVLKECGIHIIQHGRIPM